MCDNHYYYQKSKSIKRQFINTGVYLQSVVYSPIIDAFLSETKINATTSIIGNTIALSESYVISGDKPCIYNSHSTLSAARTTASYRQQRTRKPVASCSTRRFNSRMATSSLAYALSASFCPRRAAVYASSRDYPLARPPRVSPITVCLCTCVESAATTRTVLGVGSNQASTQARTMMGRPIGRRLRGRG